MGNATIVTTRDGDTVQQFQGIDGLYTEPAKAIAASSAPIW